MNIAYHCPICETEWVDDDRCDWCGRPAKLGPCPRPGWVTATVDQHMQTSTMNARMVSAWHDSRRAHGDVA